MARKITNITELINRTRYKVEDISDLDNHFDIPSLNCSLINIHLAELLRDVTLNAFTTSKINSKKVLKILANVTEHLYLLCEGCNFEIPDDDATIDDFNETMLEPELRMDAILGIMSMLRASSEIVEWIVVDNESETPIWAESNFPEEFVDNILIILCGIRNVGKKFGIRPEDIADCLAE